METLSLENELEINNKDRKDSRNINVTSGGYIHWQKDEKLYTLKEVEQLYKKGIEDGRKEVEHESSYEQRALMNQLKNDLGTAASVSSMLLDWFIKKNILVDDIYLRVNDLGNYEILIIIPNEAYSDFNFLIEIYTKISEVIQDYHSNTFYFDIALAPLNVNLNKDLMVIDGFGLRYAKSAQ